MFAPLTAYRPYSMQIINLIGIGADGSLNQLLYLIDSNSYTGKGINDYDYIHEDQVQWYQDALLAICQEEGRTVPSTIFTHIPLQEYRTAYELYKEGDSVVQCFYGKAGEKGEAICCSDYPDGSMEIEPVPYAEQS